MPSQADTLADTTIRPHTAPSTPVDEGTAAARNPVPQQEPATPARRPLCREQPNETSRLSPGFFPGVTNRREQ